MGPKRKLHAHLKAMRKKRLSTANSDDQHQEFSDNEQEEMEVDDGDRSEALSFEDRITINDMADLFEFCKSKCHIRYLSVLIYTSLRSLGVSWNKCEAFLQDIGALKAKAAHRWAKVLISGDIEEFQGENSGGKHTAEFYDYFPDLKDAAKEYTFERCSQKSADFTAIDLAKFIDKQFYETMYGAK
ncbi:unnamed protein product, partial [Didymodactylos carnosus]